MVKAYYSVCIHQGVANDMRHAGTFIRIEKNAQHILYFQFTANPALYPDTKKVLKDTMPEC